MNPYDPGDPLALPLVTPAHQGFHLSSEITQYLLDGSATTLV